MSKHNVEIDGYPAQHIYECAVCGSTQYDRLWSKDRYSYFKCGTYSVVWVSPRLTDAAVQRIYAEGFEGKLCSQSGDLNPHIDQSYLIIFKQYRKSNRLLDVECFGKERWHMIGVQTDQQTCFEWSMKVSEL